MKQRRLYGLVLAAVGLVACSPTRVTAPLTASTPPGWLHAPTDVTPTQRAALADWWQRFRDPMLNELIAAAIDANQDLRIAKARVRELRQTVTVAESALYPSLDFSANGGRAQSLDRVFAAPGSNGINIIAPAGNMFSGGLTARWEIDVFGGRRLDVEAAKAGALGAVEEQRSVLVGLLGQLATEYLELRGIQARRGILQERIDVERERSRVVRALVQAGLARAPDIARQDAQRRATEAELPIVDAHAEKLILRLGVLAGKPAPEFHARLAKAQIAPQASPPLPNLLPATVLEQRPDLRAAKTHVDAAAAKLGATSAQLYPNIVLSVSGGFGTLVTGGFGSLADSVYTLGAGLAAPLFNSGRIRAQITAADARLEQAALLYEKALLTALADIDTAYVQHHAANQQKQTLREAESAAERSYRETDALFRQGASSLLNVLDAKQTQLRISDQRIAAETSAQVALVSLYRAFGGGWTAGAPPAPTGTLD